MSEPVPTTSRPPRVRPCRHGVRIDLPDETVAAIVQAVAEAVASCGRAEDGWRYLLETAGNDVRIALDSPEYADVIAAMDVPPLLLTAAQAWHETGPALMWAANRSDARKVP